MDGEEILNTFFKKIPYKRQKEGWRVPFDANRLKGYKAVNDLVDADTGKVVVEWLFGVGPKVMANDLSILLSSGLA